MQLNELPEGWFSDGDIAAYLTLYEQLPAQSTVAELGVWQGRSLCSVAVVIRRKNLKVHAVDTFGGTPGEFEVVHDCNGRLREIFEANLARFEILDHVVIHHGSSPLTARQIIPQSLDLVFIDTDHDYETVCAEITAWLPKLKAGAVLCGHDYRFPGHRHDGVRRAVDELLGPERIRFFPGSSIWAYRMP